MVSSIGGNAAENAGGVHCVKCGLTVHNIMALRLVLSDGSVASPGSHALDAAGYDLLALSIGSEGIFGSHHGNHRQTHAAAGANRNAARGIRFGIRCSHGGGDIIAAGVTPAALEMMDKMVIEACERFMAAGFPTGAAALLLVELDGAAEELAEDRSRVETILNACQRKEIRAAQSAAEREKLWKARKGASPHSPRFAPDYYTVDGTIPRRKLPEVLQRYHELATEYGGDGCQCVPRGRRQFASVHFTKAASRAEMERAEELGGKMLEICVEVGGTITGEHGVGIRETQADVCAIPRAWLAMFHAVKAAFDPDGILQPRQGHSRIEALQNGVECTCATVWCRVPRFQDSESI